MIASRPPRLADWLLRRLASGPKQQSLIGDLHEQYRRGRSAAWYWRQTVRAIAASVVWDLRQHPLLAVRAVVLTYMFLMPWVFFTGYVYGATRWWMNDHILSRISPVPLMVVLQDAWNIWLAPLLIAWCLGWGLVGWLIASLQPHSRAGMTFVAFCAQLPWVVQYGWLIWALASAGLPMFVILPRIATVSVLVLGLPVSLVCGSLFAARPLILSESAR
jgi:hypothetical protein